MTLIQRLLQNIFFSLKGVRDNLARTVNIKIPYTCQDPKILESIKSIAAEHPGNLPLVLYLEDSNKRLEKMRFSDIRLSHSANCLKALRESLGSLTVRLGI